MNKHEYNAYQSHRVVTFSRLQPFGKAPVRVRWWAFNDGLQGDVPLKLKPHFLAHVWPIDFVSFSWMRFLPQKNGQLQSLGEKHGNKHVRNMHLLYQAHRHDLKRHEIKIYVYIYMYIFT